MQKEKKNVITPEATCWISEWIKQEVLLFQKIETDVSVNVFYWTVVMIIVTCYSGKLQGTHMYCT